jgi:hypothetical protein
MAMARKKSVKREKIVSWMGKNRKGLNKKRGKGLSNENDAGFRGGGVCCRNRTSESYNIIQSHGWGPEIVIFLSLDGGLV